MNLPGLTLSCLHTSSLQAQGNDSLASRKKASLASIVSYHTPYGYTQVQQMLPDSRLPLHPASLTTVHIIGTYNRDRRKARKRNREYSDAFYGNAHYTYGQKQAVIGNETSDYLMLFPYIMSDTAGGDLTYEEYSFGGGYARGNDKIRWGASLDYVAKQEYRKVDPRPRNITVFYNPLGGPPTYNMTGLESYLSRFSLDNASIDYAGGHYGFSLSLSPEKRSGWHSTFSYQHQLLTRISNGGSANIELDLNTLDYDIFSWKTAYWNPEHHRLPWGISLHLDYEHRYGKDIIYGPSQSDIYPELMRVQNMDIHHGEARLQADFLWNQTDEDLFLQPFAAYEFLSYRHQSPEESFDGTGISLGASIRKIWTLNGQRNHRENAFLLGGELSYRQGAGVLDPAAKLGLDARWAIGIGKTSFHIDLSACYGYFLSESWRNMSPWNEYAQRSGHSPHVFQLRLGIGFNF